MIYTAQSQYDDIENRLLIDLGIGTGMLSIGSCLLNTDYIFGFDCDHDALELCQLNIKNFQLETNIDLIQMDLRRINLPINLNRIKADTVIMNPPFGTKFFSNSFDNQTELCSIGIDMQFLQYAKQLTRHSIYSLHKTSTREHIYKKAHDWNMKMEVLAILQFDIPKLEKKQSNRKRSTANNASLKSIDVDFIRFEIKDD